MDRSERNAKAVIAIRDAYRRRQAKTRRTITACISAAVLIMLGVGALFAIRNAGNEDKTEYALLENTGGRLIIYNDRAMMITADGRQYEIKIENGSPAGHILQNVKEAEMQDQVLNTDNKQITLTFADGAIPDSIVLKKCYYLVDGERILHMSVKAGEIIKVDGRDVEISIAQDIPAEAREYNYATQRQYEVTVLACMIDGVERNICVV